MELLTRDEAARWCGDRGIVTTYTGARFDLRFSGESAGHFRAKIEGPPAQVTSMAQTVLIQDLYQPAEDDFAGALIWLRDWNIWSDSSERPALHLTAIARKAFAGSDTPIQTKPAHLFGPQEIIDAQVCALLPFVFQWDAYIVPASGRCIVLVSHEGHLVFTAQSKPVFDRAFKRFEELDWNPEWEVSS